MKVNLDDLIPGRLYYVQFYFLPPDCSKNMIFVRKVRSTYVWVSPFSHIEIWSRAKYFSVSEKK